MQYREDQRGAVERRGGNVLGDELGAHVAGAALAGGVDHALDAVDADVFDVRSTPVMVEKFLGQHTGRRAELHHRRPRRHEEVAEAARQLMAFVVERHRQADVLVELAGDPLEGPAGVLRVNLLSYLGHLILPLAA